MTILERITKLKNQGRNDEEIVRELEEQGASPKAINDAFNQARIKNAVSDSQGMDDTQREFNREQSLSPPSDDPEIEPPPAPSGKQTQEVSQDEFYSPQPQQATQQYTPQPQQQMQQDYYPQTQTEQEEQYYQPYEGYENQTGQGGYQPMGFDTDTIMEISEQVVSEKMGEIKKQVEETNEFKTLAQTRLENLTERIKRIEQIMDKLQISILDKIGSYGKNLESIKKEMTMMEDSFGKLINPLVDKAEKKHPKKTTAHKSSPRKKKSKK